MNRSTTTSLFLVLTATLACAAFADQPSQPGPAGPGMGDNAALVYWQAFAALPSTTPEQWKQQSKFLLDPVAAPLDATVEEMVKKAQPALEQLQRAAKVNRAYWSIDREAGFDAPMPHLFKARRLAQYAVLSARLNFSRGRPAEGVAELIATLRLARHVGTDPYFMALSQELEIEGNALRTAAASLKDMDAHAVEKLLAGLKSLPSGGSMTVVMADVRQRVAGLVNDLETADAKDVPYLVERRFGKQTAKSLCRQPKEELKSSVKSLLALADKCAGVHAYSRQ